MRVAIGTDHAGFPLKEEVIRAVRDAGHEPVDVGIYTPEPVDYPDFAEKVGQAIQSAQAERGILLCGSGVGVCIAANKMRGIYACLCHDTYSAHQGVQHDGMNVLCLGGRVIGPSLAAELVVTFLAATFQDEERHLRRTGKIRAIEAKNWTQNEEGA